MGLLQELDQDQGFLKAGLLGQTSSGKTYTAMLLAIATRRHFKLDGPIAMYDTEGGSQYVKGWVKEITGKPLMGVRSRSFSKLLEFGRECEELGVSVAIVDSIAHPWEELKESFKADVNKARINKGWTQRELEFQDWGKVKPMWSKWPEFYLNSKLHIIVCGRAGDIYEMEKNEETGRKELNVVGTRMQTEKNFGYEPSLLVEMSREQILEPTTHFVQRATVWKDRYGIINGASCDFPLVAHTDPKRREKEEAAVWAFLGQHVLCIKGGSYAPIDLETKTETGADEGADDDWARERKTRTILAEEIQGELVAAFPGMTAEEKKAKAGLIFEVFNTRSWTAVENKHSEILRAGLEKIRNLLHPTPAAPDDIPEPTGDAGAVLPESPRKLTAEEVRKFEELLPASKPSKAQKEAWAKWITTEHLPIEIEARYSELQEFVKELEAQQALPVGK